mmetsp:Transcript_35539/g.43560  ORF Transcript_35539/g.43560 Transcript_35539/m.43560 type:complete len:197 (+) Transcript_35539:978-1568(+)
MQALPNATSRHKLKYGRSAEPDHMVSDEEFADLDRMTGKEAFKTPLGFLDFMQGTFYGTGLVQNTTHLKICVDILAEDYIKMWYRGLTPNEDRSHVFMAIYSVLRMIWSVHPLLENCYYAPDRSLERLVGVANDWSDVRLVLTNIIHNVGFVHDAYSEVKMFFQSQERGQARSGPYEAGYGAGRMLYFVFAENAHN